MITLIFIALISGFGLFLIRYFKGNTPLEKTVSHTPTTRCSTTYHSCGVREFHIDRYAMQAQDTHPTDKDPS